MPGPTIIEIPDNGGTVAGLADLHLKSYFWQTGNPLEFHALEERLLQESVDALIAAGDLSDTLGPSLQDALAYTGLFRHPFGAPHSDAVFDNKYSRAGGACSTYQ